MDTVQTPADLEAAQRAIADRMEDTESNHRERKRERVCV
jgi:hypothetical protein